VKTAKAFSPAGISSFFEICDRTADGKPIADLKKLGARGGGFGLTKGVATDVQTSEAGENSVRVFINGREAPDAETTMTAVQMILEETRSPHQITVNHKVEIPIGTGFGSSAAGALTTTLALSKALKLDMTVNQLGRIAHAAEIKCGTGLGTVGPLLVGGCVLTLEPGAPGIAVIDRIPITSEHIIIAGVYGQTPTRKVLASSQERRREISECGRKTLDSILAEPSLENFLACCLDFARKTRFMTERLERLVTLAEKAGVIGCAQNMVGEAIHALTTSENAENVVQAFKQVLPKNKILVSNVDLEGARLLS
jgi:pantoate kinase